MRVFLTTIFATATFLTAEAYQHDADTLDDDELWAISDEIAIVQVMGGNFDPQTGVLEVSTHVRFLVKGEAGTQLHFVSRPWPSAPNQLGGIYLVHLTTHEDGLQHSMRTRDAIVQLLNPITEHDADKDRELWGDFIDHEQVVYFLQEPYVPASCSSDELTTSLYCDKDVTLLRSVLDKHRQLERANSATPL